MDQKRDRTRMNSLGVLAVPPAIDIKCYVFVRRRNSTLYACGFLPLLFLLLHLPVQH